MSPSVKQTAAAKVATKKAASAKRELAVPAPADQRNWVSEIRSNRQQRLTHPAAAAAKKAAK